MILWMLLACGQRFAGDRSLERSLALVDGDHDGKVEVGEVPEAGAGADTNGDGVVSASELRARLDADPFSFHAEDLQAQIGTPLPPMRPDRALERDREHAPQVMVRDVLRFIRRALAGAGRALPDDDLVARAATTGRLDSVPSKAAMALLRDAAVANGTPLPAAAPDPEPPCCTDDAPARTTSIPGL
jgi:hypothetical protein